MPEGGLWIDQHRPSAFKDLSYHPNISRCLKRMAASGDFPHLLFFGPSGAGKKTRAMCFLREIYGPGVDRVRLQHETFETPSNKKLEINLLASNYHLELNPSDAGIHDRSVIQHLIKATAQSSQLDSTNQKAFKVIIISEADHLTKDAQHALRRTMEKYVASCRLVLIANSVGRVIPALRSRCQAVRVPAPSGEEVAAVLAAVCKKERFPLSPDLARQLAESAERNVRVALLKCEVLKLRGGGGAVADPVADPVEAPWAGFLRETAGLALQRQSKEALLEVRKRLYALLEKCIPADVILRGLADHLVDKVDPALQPVVARLAADYEADMNKGDKVIFHLEAFVAKFMHLLLTFQSEPGPALPHRLLLLLA